ncbi:hypothetical protein ACRAWG_07145 [Methylobacterium sp. P31]
MQHAMPHRMVPNGRPGIMFRAGSRAQSTAKKPAAANQPVSGVYLGSQPMQIPCRTASPLRV